jgi:hypothetical protein
LGETTQLQGRKPSLTLTTTFKNKAIKEVGSLEIRSIPHYETNSCCGFLIKLQSSMKIHHVFHVSLLKPYQRSTILGKIHDPPPPIEVNGEQKYEMEDILDSRVFNCQL